MLHRVLRAPAVAARIQRRTPMRMLAFNAPKPKKGDPQKLLDDDLLASAGVDTDANTAEFKHWEETARKARDEQTTIKNRTRNNNYIYAFTTLAILAGVCYSALPLSEEEQEENPNVPNDWAPSSMWQRVKGRVGGTFDHFKDPSFEKLLPDPLPAPYGRPLTLVLALDDLLVKSEWSRDFGWRTAKRPGVDYFLGYLAQYYEVVIFSNKYQAFDGETILKLDPYRASISYSLFREATRFKDGKVIKDLAHLNRDLSKVICVDVDKDAVSLQPENALVIPPWNGSADDQDLVRLIPLLEWIGAQPTKDVRPTLKSYAGKDVLSEFERRDQLLRQKYKNTKGAQGAWASSLLGMSPKNPELAPQDYVRIEGQKGYKQFQKYLKEHGEKMLEEEKKREQEIMQEHKMTINKYVTQGGPTQEEIAATLARKEAEAKAAADAHN